MRQIIARLSVMAFIATATGLLCAADGVSDPAPSPVMVPLFIPVSDTAVSAESRVFEYRDLGHAALRAGFYDEAATYFTDYMNASVQWPLVYEDATLSLAESLVFAQRIPDAENLLGRFNVTSASNAVRARAAMIRARIELLRNEPTKALTLVDPWVRDTKLDTAIRADILTVVIAIRQSELDWAAASEATADLMSLLSASKTPVPETLNYAMNRQIYFDIRRGAYPRAARLLGLQKSSTLRAQCEHLLLRSFYACANGYLDSAVGRYREARQLEEFHVSPLTTGIAMDIAEKLYGAGRVNDAEEMLNDAFGTAKASEASRRKILHRLADIQIKSGNRTAAINTLTRYLSLYRNANDAVPVSVELANLHLAEGYDNEAFATYRRLLSNAAVTGEVRIDALRRFARLLSDKGRDDDARTILGEMIALSTDSAITGEGMYLTAEILVKQRRFTDALALYTKLLDNPVWREQALYCKMTVESELNRLADALQTASLIAKECKDTEILADAAFYRPHLLARNGQYAEAERGFRDFIAKDGKHSRVPDALLELGETCMKRHRYAEAASCFADLSARFPQYAGTPRGVYQQIHANYLDGNDSEAVKIARAFSSRWPQSPYTAEALFWLSDHYLTEARNDSAFRTLLQIITLRNAPPAVNARAHLEIADVFYRQGFTDSALAELTRLNSLHPDNPHAQSAAYLEGEILSSKRDWRAATSAYRRAYRLGTDSALTLASAGRIGDCLTTLFSAAAEFDDPPLREAEEWYMRVLKSPNLPTGIRVQTCWKIGHLYRFLQSEEKAVAYLMRPLLMAQSGVPVPKGSEMWLVKCADSLLDIYGKRQTPESGAKAIQICRMMLASRFGPESHWRQMIQSIESAFAGSVPTLPDRFDNVELPTPEKSK